MQQSIKCEALEQINCASWFQFRFIKLSADIVLFYV